MKFSRNLFQAKKSEIKVIKSNKEHKTFLPLFKYFLQEMTWFFVLDSECDPEAVYCTAYPKVNFEN